MVGIQIKPNFNQPTMVLAATMKLKKKKIALKLICIADARLNLWHLQKRQHEVSLKVNF